MDDHRKKLVLELRNVLLNSYLCLHYLIPQVNLCKSLNQQLDNANMTMLRSDVECSCATLYNVQLFQ